MKNPTFWLVCSALTLVAGNLFLVAVQPAPEVSCDVMAMNPQEIVCTGTFRICEGLKCFDTNRVEVLLDGTATVYYGRIDRGPGSR